MKIIKPNVELITEQDPMKKIELCGRVCYKSEDKITTDSTERFVKGIIKRRHESVLEHTDYIVMMNREEYEYYNKVVLQLKEYGIEPMLRTTANYFERRYIISGNVRMWRDFMRYVQMIISLPSFLQLFCNNILFDDVMPEISGTTLAKFISKTELLGHTEIMTHRTETVKFIVDRGVSHEIVRHRMSSFSQESTRYCNYSNDKFGNEITVIEPCFWKKGSGYYECWESSCKQAEKHYFELLNGGAKPQEARSVLPNSLKTEIIMTTNIRNWDRFSMLRCDPNAHPQMRQVATKLLDIFYNMLPEYFEDTYKFFVENQGERPAHE